MTTLLSINNLSLSFCSDDEIGGDTPVLHEVSLNIDQGETHALVGESGSGKSVTAMSILRLLEDISSVRTSGSIIFDGSSILDLSSKEIREIRGNRIAMIFQEPMTSLNPVYTIGNQLMEPLMLHQDMSKPEARERALQLLERTGINKPEYRVNAYPHQLSGGQRQRVMIAMALACRPRLLIADEPTTALDVTIQDQILDLIRGIQQEYNMAVLLITHDLPMVKKIADSVSIMHQGRIVEQGPLANIFASPGDPYTKHLLKSIPHTTREPHTGGPELITMENVRCEFVLKSDGGSLFRSQKTTIRAVDDVSLNIYKGTTLGIVGESGSGKSTLAMCLLKLNKFKGVVRYRHNGENIVLSELSNSRMRPLRKELQIVFQDPFSSLSPRLSIEQIVTEGLKVHNIGKSRAERHERMAQALLEVDLDPNMASRFPHEFSGGQRQRIAIARVIVLKPELVILDEPTSALDVTIQAQIIELLQQLQERHGMTYIFITHDLRVIRSLADQLVVMKQGKIVESGPAQNIFANPSHGYTQKLFQAAFHEA